MKYSSSKIINLVFVFLIVLAFPLPTFAVLNNPILPFKQIFTYPSCMPHCTQEDKNMILEQGLVENQLAATLALANESIHFSQYTFSRVPLFHILLAQAERGVKIRGIVDRDQWKNLAPFCVRSPPTSVGNSICHFPPPFNTPQFHQMNIQDKLILAQKSDLYQKSSVVEKLQLLFPGENSMIQMKVAPGKGRLVHHKFALIDEAYLLFGSGNWSSTAVSVNFENLTLYDGRKVLDKPIVDSFSCAYREIWTEDSQRISQELPSCQIEDRTFFVPHSAREQNILQHILGQIRKAKSSILLTMHHLTHPEIFPELATALNRNVEVRLLFDDDDCQQKGPEQLENLRKLGAKIQYLYTNCQIFQLSHNKYGIFDQQQVINGTGNWTLAGLERNYESFIIAQSPKEAEVVRNFIKNFTLLWSYSRERNQCAHEMRAITCPRISRQ